MSRARLLDGAGVVGDVAVDVLWQISAAAASGTRHVILLGETALDVALIDVGSLVKRVPLSTAPYIRIQFWLYSGAGPTHR